MKRISWVSAGGIGAVSAWVVAALAYFGNRLAGLPLVPFDLFDWLARVLPGPLVIFTIESMVKLITALHLGPTAATAKQIEKGLAIVLLTLIGLVFGLVLAWLGRRRPEWLVRYGLLGGCILLLGFLLVEIFLGFSPTRMGVKIFGVSLLWLVILFLGWGAVLGGVLRALITPEEPIPASTMSRRQFLYIVGAGSATVVVSALGLSLLGKRKASAGIGDQASIDELVGASNTYGPAASPPEQLLSRRFPPVTGTRPELTSNKEFYRIDIDSLPPTVDGNTWRLEITGLVDKPLSLSLDDLRNRPSVSQVVTLECISNNLGGDLISTAIWTGVRLKDILAEAGLHPDVLEIEMDAADGFYESMPLAEALDDRTLLVYEMNGEPLPEEHGFPLRVYIPDHFGMKQPKWITRMEAINHQQGGYWGQRGWNNTATVKTTSVIDTVNADEQQPGSNIVPVGGIAYAGARGISKVEVQVDEGPWQEAELRDPPLSPLSWVQWRFAWQSTPGRHVVRVRAYDGTGALQETTEGDPFPAGATGVNAVDTTI